MGTKDATGYASRAVALSSGAAVVEQVRGVSFDFGDTIVALDERLLLLKLEREGFSAQLARLESALPSARSAYNAAIVAASSHRGGVDSRRFFRPSRLPDWCTRNG